MYRSSDFIHEFFRELFWNRCVMLRNRSGTSPELLPNSFHGKHLHVYVKKKQLKDDLNLSALEWEQWQAVNSPYFLTSELLETPISECRVIWKGDAGNMHNRCCMSFYNVLPSLKRKTKLMKGKFLGWHFKNIMAYSMLKVIHLRSPN